ncbi:hypothetical protein ACFZBU_40745 [Embleya sp. NPDC008237]|uniref:hypothetical protein n=1 Tax=Embleya sp. NPDC008237 TaxID=3363978 RepID=UPI0036E819B3
MTGEVVRARRDMPLKSLIPVTERLCRGVDGVVSVAEHIAYRIDDARSSPGG